MKRQIRYLIAKTAAFAANRWTSDERQRILIATSQYFSRESWLDVLKTHYPDVLKNLNIVFTNSKPVLIKHFPGSDACFLFGYSDHYKAGSDRRKLLYFPLLGQEFLTGKNLPAGSTVERPPFYSAEAIAEYCFSMAVNISRGFQYAFKNKAQKRWDQREILRNPFVPLSSKKIGVLGVGNVGKVIAQHFKRNGCRVVGCDQVTDVSLSCVDQWFAIEALHDFLRTVDILVIALPLTPATKNIIGKTELALLGERKYLINVSRGQVVNEKELIASLRRETLGGAVLDVFSREPLKANSPFFSLNNAIITPHIAGNINLFLRQIQIDFIEKAIASHHV